MAEEYIMSSKACVYVLGGSTSSTAALYDFDGVYFLEGGFADNSAGFVAHVRDVCAVLLSAPTRNNLGTIRALLEKKDKQVPVLLNTKPLKSAKPDSSAEQVLSIQQANSRLLSDGPLLFTPQYPARIIYQSPAKGVLSLYIIAGDAKDGEAITKALASGNEQEVERAATEHGTIGVLLWRPAEAEKPVVRVLISGTCGCSRIQGALDKAAKSLPFLNAPLVKSKDALTAIPAPTLPKSNIVKAATPKTAAPPARSATRPTATRTTPSAPAPRAPPARGAAAAAPKPAAPRAAPPARSLTARAPVPSRPAAPPPKRAPPTNGRAEPLAQKKTVGKVAAAAPPAKKAAPVVKAEPKVAPVVAVAPVVPVEPVIEKPAEPTPTPAPIQPPPQVIVDDIQPPITSTSDLDIVVIPPTPEPPRGTDDVKAEEPQEPEKAAEPKEPVEPKEPTEPVEPEIPAPIDAFKKPDVVDDLIGDVEPSAPAVPADHVVIANDDPKLPDVAVPFVPFVSGGADELIKLDDDKEKIAPGFEEPLIPQAPREDGTLADCSEELSKLVEISMDTDNSVVVGEVTQLAQDLNHIHLDDATNDYVRKLSDQMIADATLPFTSALASSIVENNHEVEGKVENGHQSTEHNGGAHETKPEQEKVEDKHNLMQSRSSIVDGANGAPVEYEKTDPAIDEILAACAKESEQMDTVLHMPAAPGRPLATAKEPKFARPYFFDVVTVPHNEKLETTLSAEGLQEFVGKIRSRHFVLPSREISGEQLEGVLQGKQLWADSAYPSMIIPTHSSPALLNFRGQCEQRLADVQLSVALPVEKQITTVTSANVGTDYELAKINLSSL